MKVLAGRAVIVAALCVVGEAIGAEQGYVSQPTLNGRTLIFVSEGDLWNATLPEQLNDEPVLAHRLTSGAGNETRPTINPDGTQVAFSAKYDGNTDVYVMPVEGGMPRRLTEDPGEDTALAWMPDSGSVLFSSGRRHPFGHGELWSVSTAGGMAKRFDFGECSMVSLSATGRRFAFTRWSNEDWSWKRYRGGTAPDVWVGEFGTETFKKLTDNRASDLYPMWIGDRVYFASDRDGTMNIWSDKAEGGDVKQHTKFKDGDGTEVEGYDLKWPSVDCARGGKRIVFCQGGRLAILDTTKDSVKRLNVQLVSDRAFARQRFAPLMETVSEFALTNDGSQLVVGSRGELVTVDVESGDVTQLTRSSGSREWGAAIVGDDRLVMISDTGGEQEIAWLKLDGSTGLPQMVTQQKGGWMYPPATSRDDRFVAYGDSGLYLNLVDLQTLVRRPVDQAEAGEIREYEFSPDSQWLAYSKPMMNGLSAVFVYSIRTGRTIMVSTGLQNDRGPRWDPAGKYLYMLSDRQMNPVMGPLDMEHVLVNMTEVIAVALADSTPAPTKEAAKMAGFDLEQWAESAKTDESKKENAKEKTEDAGEDAEKDDAKAQATEPAIPTAMVVDVENISSRQYRLGVEPGNYDHLEALNGGVCFMSEPLEGLLDEVWPAPALGIPKGVLKKFDCVKGEESIVATGISEYAMDRARAHVAHPKADGTGFTVISLAGEGEPKQVDLSSAQLRVTPIDEWKQILDEAWRLQRDFYWAKNYVGVKWDAMKTKYESLLPRVGTREELNMVLGEMLGELGTSHEYVWGGEMVDKAKSVSVGLLGADIEIVNGMMTLTHVIPSVVWAEDTYSPLGQPYLKVKDGSVILAVNGIVMKNSSDLEDSLQDMAGKLVKLKIADDAAGANTREITVKTLDDETSLRYAAWVERNRKYVDEKSGGSLGYLHIPDMQGEGLSMFSKLFYGQFDKKGFVIDVRDNGGGFVSQMIIERLARKPWAYSQPRLGVTERVPMRGVDAHMAVLINEHAGSDGDIFPASFKLLGMGPLIGTRTWGGVIGISGDKMTVDMGMTTQPESAWWEAKGGWTIENDGVAPDIDVEISPGDCAQGHDPQLDKAIELLMEKLKTDPKDQPKPPPLPVRVGH